MKTYALPLLILATLQISNVQAGSCPYSSKVCALYAAIGRDPQNIDKDGAAGWQKHFDNGMKLEEAIGYAEEAVKGVEEKAKSEGKVWDRATGDYAKPSTPATSTASTPAASTTPTASAPEVTCPYSAQVCALYSNIGRDVKNIDKDGAEGWQKHFDAGMTVDEATAIAEKAVKQAEEDALKIKKKWDRSTGTYAVEPSSSSGSSSTAAAPTNLPVWLGSISNLTLAQAKILDQKYYDTFGYHPSPATLQVFGYGLNGQNPLTIDQVAAQIKKNSNVDPSQVHRGTLVEAGIQWDSMPSTDELQNLDWKAILSSPKPQEAYDAAKYVYMNTPRQKVADGFSASKYVSGRLGAIVASTQKGEQYVSLISYYGSDGTLLSNGGMGAISIMKKLDEFAINPSELNGLANVLDENKIIYRYEDYKRVTGSDQGANLRELATGSTGTPVGAISTLSTNPAAAREQYIADIIINDQYAYYKYQNNLNLAPSLLNTQLAPKVENGVTKNYVVVNGSSAKWFATLTEAINYKNENGGVAQDLTAYNYQRAAASVANP